MSKKCAKCDKTVYPAEEFKCLDKTWHKGCFKCSDCGMTLNMKNYKGYNKMPYCSAHYPQLKATVVAETPEGKRVAELSKLQSQVVYHAEFENNIKGTVTSMADDPEIGRQKKIAGVLSQASYTRDVQAEPTGNFGGRRSEYDDDENEPPPRQYVPPQLPGARMLIMPNAAPPSQPPPQVPPPQPTGPVYQAMYDYDAQDEDEVSFQENDRIIKCEVIDEGWMRGTVERTRKSGMIPANYVEKISL